MGVKTKELRLSPDTIILNLFQEKSWLKSPTEKQVELYEYKEEVIDNHGPPVPTPGQMSGMFNRYIFKFF